MLTKKEIEEYIIKFPVYQYVLTDPAEVEHSEKVRMFCKRDCKRYDTNWACPPAVPSIKKCKSRCMQYEHVLLFSSVASTEGLTAAKRKVSKEAHEDLTKLIEDYLIKNGYQIYSLTSDTCTMCSKCTFPHEYCRHAEIMHPCIESHGIIISDLAAKFNMDYNMGNRLYLWFSLIYFSEAKEEVVNE